MRRLTILFGAGAAVAAVVIWFALDRHVAPAGQPSLRQLDGATLGDFRQEFNQASDQVRVVLLLSPT
jgi:hypothetical protein